MVDEITINMSQILVPPYLALYIRPKVKIFPLYPLTLRIKHTCNGNGSNTLQFPSFLTALTS